MTKQLQDAGKEYKRWTLVLIDFLSDALISCEMLFKSLTEGFFRLVRVVEVLRSGESREGHTQRILAIMRSFIFPLCETFKMVCKC